MIERKDSKDIIYDNYKIHHRKLEKGMKPTEHDKKKWVAVDDIIQRLIEADMLDVCRIIKELKQGEEDKEVENGKSINKNVR